MTKNEILNLKLKILEAAMNRAKKSGIVQTTREEKRELKRLDNILKRTDKND
jgi:hypothetical protein